MVSIQARNTSHATAHPWSKKSLPTFRFSVQMLLMGIGLLTTLFLVFLSTSVLHLETVQHTLPGVQQQQQQQQRLAADHSNAAADANQQSESAETKSSFTSEGHFGQRRRAMQTTEPRATVAYAVSVTGCGSDPITEGAAVLKHSIHLASHYGDGQYGYQMFAIYHPVAKACAAPLEELGYQLLERQTPVAVADIEGEYLRSKIESNGCCGEKELIKLYAYTLTDYPIVVHLDLDVLVLKPLDDLFDMMLHMQHPEQELDPTKKQNIIMWQNGDNNNGVASSPLPDCINAFYTVDYNMVRPQTKYKPVQGGFLVTRPNQTVFDEYCDIIRKGDFRASGGWGGQVGPFYGSMTFQGIIPYYYLYLHPGEAVELNRCIYNQMCDNPRTEKTVNDVVHGDCRTGQRECEDCRSRPLEDVVTMHATLCQKFWWCLPHNQDAIQHRLCRKLTTEWYKIRSDLEQSWGRSGQGPGNFEMQVFNGYCTTHGKNGYVPIAKPYGGKSVQGYAMEQ